MTVSSQNQGHDTFLAHHMPEHSGVREQAHKFLTEKLAMGSVLPVERLAVLPNGTFGMSEGGLYYTGLDSAFVIDPKSGKPITNTIQRLSAIAHEFSHSATTDSRLSVEEHPYFSEALAGLAEYKVLRRLEELGYSQAPRDVGWMTLRGAKLYIPSSVRKVDRREDKAPITADMKVNSSNGLIAAISVGPGLVKTGVSSANVLQGDGPSRRRYDQLKEAVEAIEPGLVDKIEKTERTPNVVYEAASLVQQAAIKQAAKT